MMKKRIVIFSLFVWMVATAFALENITVGNTTRTMIVYAPNGLPASPALVIACHGANQDAAYLQSLSKWETVADTAKFVVVYANGVNKYWDISGTSDLQFMQAIIDKMYERYHINRNRVYLTGFSMGGMFTYYAASKMADKIAAFAPVSGYLMGGPNATSSRPVPILHTHGTADDVCVYSNVQSHIDAWVKFNGCNTTPEVIKPYPASKPNSPASLKRYKNGKNGVEVALLTLADKGHWWSMDASQALTSEEVWNFCKRYTLGADAPEVTSITPENLSFDMLAERDNRFEVTFNEDVDCSQISATLASAQGGITLDVLTQGFASTVNFAFPADATIADGENTLTICNAKTKKGGVMDNTSFTYYYGIEEVGETLRVDTIYAPDWYAERETVGEGIPTGWRRVNTTSSGATESISGPVANCTGVRMKYFELGGDFDAGFYLSARDNQKCNLYYGTVNGNLLKLKAGKYRASFRSVYWSEGAMTNRATFSFHVMKNITTSLSSATSLLSTGTMKENTNQQVKGSKIHEIDFTVSSDANYALCFEMDEGWNSVIVGDVVLTTQPSVADRYKGTFLRTLHAAQAAIVGYEDTEEGKALQQVIDQYADFVSTAPSAYAAATEAVDAALVTFRNAREVSAIYPSVQTVGTSRNAAVYSLAGMKRAAPQKGINVVRSVGGKAKLVLQD
ncbi:MAG: hypothetical protein IJK42_01785 [Prevotella sp.]|nr:hypothetical protein [Prevotella sp.]